MPTVTVNPVGYALEADNIRWIGSVSLGSTFSASGEVQTLHQLTLYYSGPQCWTNNPEFTRICR